MAVTDRILLVSEYFPPAIGGSSELFSNVYTRMAGDVSVLTTIVESTAEAPVEGVPVVRTRFPAGLGLLTPSALLEMLHLSRRLATLASERTVIHCGRALPEGTASWSAR